MCSGGVVAWRLRGRVLASSSSLSPFGSPLPHLASPCGPGSLAASKCDRISSDASSSSPPPRYRRRPIAARAATTRPLRCRSTTTRVARSPSRSPSPRRSSCWSCSNLCAAIAVRRFRSRGAVGQDRPPPPLRRLAPRRFFAGTGSSTTARPSPTSSYACHRGPQARQRRVQDGVPRAPPARPPAAPPPSSAFTSRQPRRHPSLPLRPPLPSPSATRSSSSHLDNKFGAFHLLLELKTVMFRFNNKQTNNS